MLPLVSLLVLAACDSTEPPPGEDAGPMVTPCDYPEFTGDLGLGQTLPAWRWENAQTWDGSAAPVDMREFFCSPEYDQYDSIVLVVSAGWCSACPGYIRDVDSMSRAIEDARGLILYLEVETADFEPATSEAAATYINGLIADGPGMRMGDADNAVPNSVRGLVSRMPSGYVIRRRDMQIIADQKESIYVIDFPGLAADPEQTWVPTPPPFEANCGPTDEEASEPNDAVDTAAPIADGAEVLGGICAEGSDFYRVDLPGPWRFDLWSEFLTTREDLNLRLYTLEGERIGGSTQRSNHDWVDYEGPALVEVYGFENASATYRVTLGPQP